MGRKVIHEAAGTIEVGMWHVACVSRRDLSEPGWR